MGDANSLISVKNIVKTYTMGDLKVDVLKGISFDVNKGDFIAIMGASGSGKSTFMNIIGCLDVPTKGEYYLNGIDVFSMNKNELAELRNRNIGFIFQSFNLLPRTTALENVELPLLYNNQFSAKERKEHALEALRSVGLYDFAHHMPNQLSGGQQQRVAIARSLINSPLVIMADEPTGNLDSRASYEIMSIFQELNDKGITIIMVTHEPDIAQCAKTNVVFRDGRVIANQPVVDRKIAKDILANLPVEEKEALV